MCQTVADVLAGTPPDRGLGARLKTNPTNSTIDSSISVDPRIRRRVPGLWTSDRTVSSGGLPHRAASPTRHRNGASDRGQPHERHRPAGSRDHGGRSVVSRPNLTPKHRYSSTVPVGPTISPGDLVEDLFAAISVCPVYSGGVGGEGRLYSNDKSKTRIIKLGSMSGARQDTRGPAATHHTANKHDATEQGTSGR